MDYHSGTALKLSFPLVPFDQALNDILVNDCTMTAALGLMLLALAAAANANCYAVGCGHCGLRYDLSGYGWQYCVYCRRGFHNIGGVRKRLAWLLM